MPCNVCEDTYATWGKYPRVCDACLPTVVRVVVATGRKRGRAPMRVVALVTAEAIARAKAIAKARAGRGVEG